LNKNYLKWNNFFLNEKSVSRSPSAETRWRACEEAVAAAAGPKRREALATGARQKKSVSRSPSAETRWRACEEAVAAAAGPKRREALATGARHHEKSVRRPPIDDKEKGVFFLLVGLACDLDPMAPENLIQELIIK
jgi:hypothetical protein